MRKNSKNKASCVYSNIFFQIYNNKHKIKKERIFYNYIRL